MDTETELEVNEKTRHEDKVVHLQMIQGVIDRMSTSAAIYKGFAATIVTGIAAISFTEVSAWILLIAFLPVICFLMMDRSFMMQMQHGLNACSLQASGCSMLPLLPLEW